MDRFKRSWLILFSLVILTASLDAKELYIKLMTVKYTSSIAYAGIKLKELGYGMYLHRYNKLYEVYAGPFFDDKEAQKALKKIRKRVAPNAVVTTGPTDVTLPAPKEQEAGPQRKYVKQAAQSALSDKELKKQAPHALASTILTEPEQPIADGKNKEVLHLDKEMLKEVPDKVVPASFPKKGEFFIGASLGVSHAEVKQRNINGALVLDTRPDETGINGGVEMGYNIREKVYVTLNYQHSDFDNLKYDSMYAALNYRFGPFSVLSPFVGVIAGYSDMTWKETPLDAAAADEKSGSFIGGFQAGFEHSVQRRLSIYMAYQYKVMDHLTKAKTVTAEAEFEHSPEQNVHVGVRYGF